MLKVTVVMPVYNGSRYLSESIESVLAQTFHDYEIVCVDDGSTDDSVALLGAYGQRIRVVRQENAGQSAARNAGVRLARGEYIAFLDQDDVWYPSKLQNQVAVLQAQPDVVLVHCNFDRIDERGQMLERGAGISERMSALASSMGQLIGEALIFPSAMMIRKDAYERIGGFHHALQGFEDFDLMARLTQQGRFVMVEERGMAYRMHGSGFTRTGGIHVIRSRETFLRRMQELYRGHRTKQAIVTNMLADCYSDWGIHDVRSGNRQEGRIKLVQSLRCNPLKFRTYSRLLRAFLPQGRI
jgi:glycosyltransferase involved in cell wall biosynthesis